MAGQQQEIPNAWNQQAHHLWVNNNINGAIETVLAEINATPENKPKGPMIQFGYYLFLLKDYNAAANLFENLLADHPDDKQVLTNLIVSLSRSGNDEKTINYAIAQLRRDNKNFTLWDTLAKSFQRTGQLEKAASAGKNSLVIKDKLYNKPDSSWSLPQQAASEAAADKKRVIAFSLWGNQARYIYGSLRNLLLANDLYPDWELWFYVDDTVPPQAIDLFKQLGAKIILQASGQSERQRLCWRFQVANAPDVGYFLVRDADSVFSVRECLAVDEWLDSGKYFHIIRDWWTHTDLILAGLWGGVAGVLPDIKADVDDYSPESVHTPNIDQWYLRDRLWRHIKQSCLIHDRCFDAFDAIPVPGKIPEGNAHIGSCEFHQSKELQLKLLSPWLEKLT